MRVLGLLSKLLYFRMEPPPSFYVLWKPNILLALALINLSICYSMNQSFLNRKLLIFVNYICFSTFLLCPTIFVLFFESLFIIYSIWRKLISYFSQSCILHEPYNKNRYNDNIKFCISFAISIYLLLLYLFISLNSKCFTTQYWKRINFRLTLQLITIPGVLFTMDSLNRLLFKYVSISKYLLY